MLAPSSNGESQAGRLRHPLIGTLAPSFEWDDYAIVDQLFFENFL